MARAEALRNPPSPRLPDSIQKILALPAQDGRVFAPADIRVEPSDVFVASFPKCGTTWMQQIVHGLRTGGSMDFEEISLVIPWLEFPRLSGVDLGGPQVASPRAFKSHLRWEVIPKGGRYLYITRAPADALVSFYHFLEGWMFEPGACSVQDIYEGVFLNDLLFGNYWAHLRSWWQVRERDDVLLMTYEDLIEDLAGSVRRIGAFMGLDVDDALAAKVTHQASFAFMHAHQGQFDDHPTTVALNALAGLPLEVRTTKVRTGRVGDSARLPASIHAALDAAWKEDIEGPLGIPSYDRLRQLLNESLDCASD
ncbi:sulfotransferase domain-containing protein [Myxococcus stipitatus]|uniref:sulfotransferase domain-containing protein n=1 Tax=Myxococcus stipitatus TaxID=83455 RepID=UPI003144E676